MNYSKEKSVPMELDNRGKTTEWNVVLVFLYLVYIFIIYNNIYYYYILYIISILLFRQSKSLTYHRSLYSPVITRSQSDATTTQPTWSHLCTANMSQEGDYRSTIKQYEVENTCESVLALQSAPVILSGKLKNLSQKFQEWIAFA